MRTVPSFVASAAVLPALLVACVAREHFDARHINVRQVPPVVATASGATSSVAGSSPPVVSGTLTGTTTGTGAATTVSGVPSGGVNTSVIVISDLPTTTFSLEATNPTAVPLSSIVVNAPSAPTSPLSSIPTPGTVPNYMPNAPPIPNGEFYL